MPPAVVNSAATEENPRKTEALRRLEEARREKSQIENDLQNCYFYAAPRRIRRQGSNARSQTMPNDDRQLQTSFGFEVSDDFASMLIETFMPREGEWSERRLPPNPDEDGKEDPDTADLNKAIAAEDKKVFGLIRSSNFYAELGKTAKPDAAIGVVAMVVTDPGSGRDIQCVGVPIGELDMSLGPDGRPDFRSITRNTKARNAPAHLGETLWKKVDDKKKKELKDKPDADSKIVWAWWRNWETFGKIEYTHVVLLDGELLHEATLTGEGSMALVLGRFNASPDFAWPNGPLIESLADLVQLDELRGAMIENIDFTLRPPKAYEDDGTINVPDDGLRPGDLVPKRPSGGQAAFEDIYSPRPIDSALFEVDTLKTSIRRLHYVDFPEQRGKTPPTATQWIDELVIRQRRIGTPGYAFWHEFPYEVFQRFRHLGEQRGTVRKLSAISGFPSGVSLQPYNPAERAQDSQDISNAVRFAQTGQAIAPTMWQIVLNEAETLKNLQRKFRDEVVVFRDDADVQKRIQMISQLGEIAVGQGIEQQRRGGSEE